MKGIIIYSTKYGSVEKAAKILQANLNDDVTLINIMTEKVPSIKEFDTVILGGSVYVGRVQKELSCYIEQHIDELLSKRIGLFICGAQEKNDKGENEIEVVFPKNLCNYATAKENFGYEFNFEKASFFDKIALRCIVKARESSFKIKEDVIGEFAKKMLE